MTSSDQGNTRENIEINPDLVRHSDYDIEVNDDDGIMLVKDVNKVVVDPTIAENTIEFRKNKNTLLVVPIKDIEDIDVIQNLQTSSGKNLDITITFNDNQQNKKSITFRVKNNKYANAIDQQIRLLKDAEGDPSIQKKIKSILNPELCNECMSNKYVFEFRSTGNLCSNCFEDQYGKTLLQTKEVEYHGGHTEHPLGGILGKHSQSGKMYLTANSAIFAKDDKEVSKRWEIFIPLSSVILNRDIEQQQRQKFVQWEATNYNNFGFGCGFIRESKKSYRLVIPYIDNKGTAQEPEFSIKDIRMWASELYIMSIKDRMNLSQQQTTSEEEILQTTGNCFNCGRQFQIYELVICDHCITSFCDVCIRNHSVKQEIEYDSKYMGGHKLYPKSSEVKVSLFADRIEIEALHIRMSYTSITDVENADEKKITTKRMFLVGLYAFAWKKKDLFTIIEYIDGDNPLRILQIRFAKGEISKEEYEEMRKMLES